MCFAREEPLIPEGCKINSEEDGSVGRASLGLCTVECSPFWALCLILYAHLGKGSLSK